MCARHLSNFTRQENDCHSCLIIIWLRQGVDLTNRVSRHLSNFTRQENGCQSCLIIKWLRQGGGGQTMCRVIYQTSLDWKMAACLVQQYGHDNVGLDKLCRQENGCHSKNKLAAIRWR